MPSKTEKQHRAMEAAAHGHSTLGIPPKVGQDFVAADAGKAHMADGGDAPAPTADVPMYVKGPDGHVIAIHTPEDITAARANGFKDATFDEAQESARQHQLKGVPGAITAGVSGAAQVIPFAHHILSKGAQRQVEEANAEHPYVHAAGEIAGIASGAGMVGAADAAGSAAETLASEAVGDGAAGAIPSLAQRVLGRAANNATQGLGYATSELSNETDLPADPGAMAEHVLATAGLGIAGGVIGGEVAHGVIKGASKLADMGSKLFGKASDSLTEMAESFKAGATDASSAVRKHAANIQNALDHNDKVSDGLVDLVNKAEKAGATPEEVASLDAARIKAEDDVDVAKRKLLRLAGGPEEQPGGKATTRKIKVGKILKAMNAGDAASRDELVGGMQQLVDSSKQLNDLHEKLSQHLVEGDEGLKGAAQDQMQELLEASQDIQQGATPAAPGALAGGLAGSFGELGGLAALAHFHPAIAGVVGAARAVGKVLDMTPPAWKANVLARMAKVAGHIDDHLAAVAKAGLVGEGISSRYVAPAVAMMSVDEYRRMRADVNEQAGNPQLLMDKMQQKYGKLQAVAPQTYGQLGIALGSQMEMIQQALATGPTAEGFLAKEYQPSLTELAKVSQTVAVIKDPRVAETAFARGTLTPAMAAAYAKAWPKRSQQFSVHVGTILSEEKNRDKVTMRAMSSLAAAGLGTPRPMFSGRMIGSTQAVYAQRATQKGGVGSRGGTSGASHISSASAIQSFGQRVANRPVK